MTKFEEEIHKNGGTCFEVVKNGKTFYEIQGLTNSPLKIFRDWQPQQALPVVPECVAVAIESLPGNYSAFEAISLINAKIDALPEENKDWLPVYNWLCDDIKNQDIFALAFITGKYEIEKPQLFYIEFPNVYGLKNKIFVSKVKNGTIVEFSNKKNYALKFTEQEIKAIDERYWQFAVPVEV